MTLTFEAIFSSVWESIVYGCGCKKKKAAQPAPAPKNISATKNTKKNG